MTLHMVTALALGLAVIIGLARLLGEVARRLGQPAVIGEILGGILLGPTFFHGALTTTLFPADIRPSLKLLANIGVCIFMFLVGLEFDRGLLRGQGRIVATISLTSMAVPFALGTLLAFHLLSRHPVGNSLGFVLFLGVAMSITAVPVLARILTDRGLIHTPIGGMALAIAAIGDVLAWSMLAVVAGLVGVDTNQWRLLLALPFVAVMLLVVRPLLARLAARPAAGGRFAAVWVAIGVCGGLYLSAEATEWIGLHLIFGAFLFGIVMPREGAVALRRHALTWIEKACAILLLPIFFMIAGLNVNLSAVDLTALGEMGLILLVAIGGKFGGAMLGARATGITPRYSAVLGVLVNTRGLTELIVLTVGLQLGVIDGALYSLMVVMALVTTAMTGVLLPWVYPAERIQTDLARRRAFNTAAGQV